jgi:hypothetical protein
MREAKRQRYWILHPHGEAKVGLMGWHMPPRYSAELKRQGQARYCNVKAGEPTWAATGAVRTISAMLTPPQTHIKSLQGKYYQRDDSIAHPWLDLRIRQDAVRLCDCPTHILAATDELTNHSSMAGQSWRTAPGATTQARRLERPLGHVWHASIPVEAPSGGVRLAHRIRLQLVWHTTLLDPSPYRISTEGDEDPTAASTTRCSGRGGDWFARHT